MPGPTKGKRFRSSRRATDAPASGALAGVASITFGQTGALTASGALAATAAITLGQSGNLTATGVLAGSSALAFDQAGVLTGTASLSGTSALTFGQTGDIVGAGDLTGSAVMTFGASATADQPLGALSGTASISFSGTGALTGEGTLTGLAALTFTAVGTLDQPVSDQPPQGSGVRSLRDLETLLTRHTEDFDNPVYTRHEPPKRVTLTLPRNRARNVPRSIEKAPKNDYRDEITAILLMLM